MTWQIFNTEPAFGICDQCRKHDCGIIDGEHKWIMTGIYDRYDNAIVIGYKCVELWANNLGISREVVETEVVRDPTEQEVGTWVLRNMVMPAMADSANELGEALKLPLATITENMDRSAMKAWLNERGIPYFKGAKDEQLRELVMQHAAKQEDDAS